MIKYTVFAKDGTKLGYIELSAAPDIVRLENTDRFFKSAFSYGPDGFRYEEIDPPPSVTLLAQEN